MMAILHLSEKTILILIIIKLFKRLYNDILFHNTPKLHKKEQEKTFIKLYYEAQYRMYRWNTSKKFVQTNLNMRYLD